MNLEVKQPESPGDALPAINSKHILDEKTSDVKQEETSVNETPNGLVQETRPTDGEEPKKKKQKRDWNVPESQPVRSSTRVRTAPTFFIDEFHDELFTPLNNKAARNAAKKKATAAAATASAKVSKKKVPSVKSIKIKRPTPPPEFSRVDATCTWDVLWQKIMIREFFCRFDILCRLQQKFRPIINDPTRPWPAVLYKSMLVCLFKLIIQDNTTPPVENTRDFLVDLEKISLEEHSGDSDESTLCNEDIWPLLSQYLCQAKALPLEFEVLSEPPTELQLHQWINKLIQLVAATDLVRATLQQDLEELRRLQNETTEHIKELKANLDIQTTKLNKSIGDATSTTVKERYTEKLETAKSVCTNKIYKAEREMFILTRKFNQRTLPLGKDKLDNLYWHFQYMPKDGGWGSWILCQKSNRFLHPSGENQVVNGNKVNGESQPPKTGTQTLERTYELYYVSGQANVKGLIAWIKAQSGEASVSDLVKELELIVQYICD